MFVTVGAKPALYQCVGRMIVAALLADSRSLESPGARRRWMPRRHRRNGYVIIGK